jgi:TP901 family phage tail tape measure protein
MAERRVKVVFSAEIQNYKASMEAAAQATEKTKKAAEDSGKASEKASKTSADGAKEAAAAQEKHRAAVEEVGRVSTLAGAAILAGVGLAVKAYADFDKQMSSVDAATHETTENMGRLRQAAIDAGSDTAFSAAEAAQGIEELAKAGVSTDDVLSGGLKGSLDLAAAGSLEVGEAAEIAASALTQFKLKGDKIPHLADLLAAGAGKAQGSVRDLGAALNQSGLVAASTGLTIEETTGALAAFASAGLTGSDAGTSFKTMLMSLTPSSKEAATLMDELGISAYDAQGNFIGMSEFAGVLQTALRDMSDEQRNATLKTIFGSDAVRAANVLYEQGAEGIGKWEAAVNDAGYAADTAARMQDNLAGDLEKLGGAFDTVLLQSGSGANEVLRGMVQGLEGVVDALGTVPAPVLSATTGFAAVLGGAALLGGGLITVIPKIRDTKEALEVLAPAGSKANAALSRTGKIAAGAASALTAVATAAALAGPALDNILKPTGETGDALQKFAGQAAQGSVGADVLNKSFQDLVQHKEGVGDFQTAIEGIADPGIWGNIDNVLVGTIKVLTLGMADVTSTSDTARERFKAFGEELASLDPKKAAESFRSMAEQTDGSETSLKRLLEYMPAYRKSLEEVAKASGLATDDQTLLNIALGKVPTDTSGMDGQAKAIEEAGKAAEESKAKAEDIAKALEDVGLSAQGAIVDIDKFGASLFSAGLLSLSASDASIAYQAAIDNMTESIKTNGTSLDLNTEQGRANQSAFNGIAQAAMKSAEATAAETLSTQGSAAAQAQLQSSLRTSYDDLVRAAGQLGITGDEADTMARKALGIPKQIPIDSWVNDKASSTLDGIKTKADGLDGRTVTIYTEERIRVIREAGDTGTANAMVTANQYASGNAYRATGGRVPGFSEGGRLPGNGPGTEGTDGFLGVSAVGAPLVRVDAAEWIINRASSDRYNRELAAINAGTFPKLPGYADGGRAGREWSAQQLGYMPARAGAAVAGSGVSIGNVTINDQSNPVATWHELNRRVIRLGI